LFHGFDESIIVGNAKIWKDEIEIITQSHAKKKKVPQRDFPLRHLALS
jgi:hypothetical protein